MIPAMMQKPFAVAAAVLIAPAPGWGLGLPATAAEIRAGHVLVANQQSASASLIDLATSTARVIPVGVGPHEAVIAPSGRVAVVTVYGVAGAPGNELAVIDVPKGVVSRTISLGQYTRPHGAMFLPGDETRVVV